jgi:hypothetical protein
MKYKCGGCAKETNDNRGWIYFAFKHLHSVWLCPECRPVWSDHMVKCQEKGL